ncbi:hypothetical protein [Mycoplasma feriruminatoris]|uniref:YobI-like P-loop NTPase domain-containing protein n=1 Tax=Mycoplasma feriruminatoris TaxID=1179777 RepID=A0AAQ3HX65_9MOLU|nr:hypothetical protein [Mycoplasma feriruminatoris]WFQ93842.1 hypothetical protein MFERI15181_00763 [Mycoplasma feriruminatoris]WFQ95504.1 hypothetical protein MFERI15407_00765 [Mycoplasma feriruminatoris]
MANNESKFVSLAPIILDKPDDIYDEALDFALSKEQKFITNIAITGPYGSGKSTIWSSYEAKRKEKLGNVITVSFSKYYESLGKRSLEEEKKQPI